MATQIGIRELRDNLTHVMRRVGQGEVIEVTRHGETVAEMRPASALATTSPLDDLIAAGLSTKPAPLARPLERFAAVGRARSEDVVEQGRGG